MRRVQNPLEKEEFADIIHLRSLTVGDEEMPRSVSLESCISNEEYVRACHFSGMPVVELLMYIIHYLICIIRQHGYIVPKNIQPSLFHSSMHHDDPRKRATLSCRALRCAQSHCGGLRV